MINPFIHLTKRPTLTEYAIIAVVLTVLLIVVGIVALVIAYSAPPDKAHLAAQLARYGWLSLGLGVFVGVAIWLFRRFMDSL